MKDGKENVREDSKKMEGNKVQRGDFDKKRGRNN